jgi:hypothetical protein
MIVKQIDLKIRNGEKLDGLISTRTFYLFGFYYDFC